MCLHTEIYQAEYHLKITFVNGPNEIEKRYEERKNETNPDKVRASSRCVGSNIPKIRKLTRKYDSPYGSRTRA